ncbi:hypothetical protein [Propionispora sp. 2/2-37]|uniref:hypothetical protein n=1 Tax=Propionispora sp. 2/2-37 TaxID=1677858 RepID=UPI0012E18342|nr:hypothetical protein [Propionispora sp. 2/2-37]
MALPPGCGCWCGLMQQLIQPLLNLSLPAEEMPYRLAGSFPADRLLGIVQKTKQSACVG